MIGEKWVYLERYTFHSQTQSRRREGPRLWGPLKKGEWLWGEFFFLSCPYGCVTLLKFALPSPSCCGLTAPAEGAGELILKPLSSHTPLTC